MTKFLMILIVGILTFLLTFFKPNFYWNSRKAKRARAIFGDFITQIIYYTLSIILSFIGIIGTLGNILY